MKKVFVGGNISLDLVLGEIDTFPGWGVELLIPGYTMRPGGQSSNAVMALGSLKVPVYVIGTVGVDNVGQDIRNSYEKWGVNSDFLFELPNIATGLSVALTNRTTHERTFLTELGAQKKFSHIHLDKVYSHIQDGDYLLICGYFLSNSLRNDKFVHFLHKIKKEKPKTILLLDTGWPPEGWTNQVKNEILKLLPCFDYFLPNEIEVVHLTNDQPTEIFNTWSGALVVKTGKDGSRVMTCDEVYHIPTIQVEVKDTIGAGDYFNAGFIWGLWKGFDLLQSTRVANIIASLNISLDAQRSKLANPTDVDKVLEKFD